MRERRPVGFSPVSRSKSANSATRCCCRLLALSFFVWCASPSLCLQPRPQLALAAPPDATLPALITAVAGILTALIASVTALIISRKTAKDVKTKISLDDLLKPEVVDPLIAVIQDKRHFVSEDHILDALTRAYVSYPAQWAQFRNLIQDQSLVIQMVEKSPEERRAIARDVFSQLAPLLGGGSEARPIGRPARGESSSRGRARPDGRATGGGGQ